MAIKIKNLSISLDKFNSIYCRKFNFFKDFLFFHKIQISKLNLYKIIRIFSHIFTKFYVLQKSLVFLSKSIFKFQKKKSAFHYNKFSICAKSQYLFK